MAKDIKLSKAEIEELRSLLRLLKEEMSETEFENLLKSGPAAKKMLQDLRAEANEFTSDIGGTIESFSRLMNEIKGTKSGINQVLDAFKGINKLATDIQYAQRGITTLTEKDIAKLEEKMAMKKVDLENANNILKAEQKDLENSQKKNEFEKESIKAKLEVIKNIEKEFGLSKKLKKERKELEKQEEKANKHSEEIEKSLKRVLDTNKEIEGVLSKQDGHYNTLTATLAKLKRQLEDQNKLLGLGGAIIGSLDAALGQLGLGRLAEALGISEAKTEMDSLAKKIIKDREEQLALEKEISDEIDSRTGEKLSPEVLAEKLKQLDALKGQNAQYDGLNGKLAVLKKGVSSMGVSLVKNLTNPVTLTIGAVTQLLSTLKSSDEATGQLAKNFGVSYNESLNLRKELNEVANSTGNVNITSQNLQKSLVDINSAFGTNAKISQEELITMTELTQQAGYQAEELTNIYKISKATGKDFEKNTKAVLGTAVAFNAVNKLAINEKEVLKEVNKMSASLKLSLGGSAEKMAETVLKTKALGLSLEQADKMAEGLLSFESSISSEMEAEMLTGKSLNFERARLLALNNDVAGAAEEIVKQVEKAGDFTKMNRIQQEAVAKAAGMTREELAQSIIDKKALTKLGAQEGTALEAYNKLKKEGLSDEAIAAKLGDDKLTQQLKSQSVQEQFNATVEKLKEIFVSLSEPILNMVNSLTPVFNIIGGIASGVGTVINFFNKITGGALPAIIGLMLTWKLLTGGIGQGILGIGKSLIGTAKSVGSIFSSLKEEGIAGAAKNIKSKFSGGSKADDLAGKAKDKADKTSGAAKGGDNAKGFADRMKNIAKGIAAFGTKEVLFGALNLIPVSIGLIAMIPGFLGAKAIEKLDGKKLKTSLEGLAKGIEAFGSGKVTAGAANLILVSIGLTAMIPGVLGALAIQSINGKAIKKSLEGLASGLEAMAKGKVLLGAGALTIASVGLVAALPGMLAAAALGAIGPLVEKGLKAFASGIERLATGKVLLGALAIAALGASLIPAAYALQMFSEISWGDLAKAGVALVGLGVAGAAFGSFLPLMLAGAVAIAALGTALIPFGIALNIMAPALEKFTPIIETFGGVIEKVFTGITGVITSASDGLSNLFKTLGEVDPIKLFAIGPALMSIGAGLAVLGGGSLAGGILGSIGKLFGGGVVEKLNELSSIDSSKILTLAEAIAKLSESITNLNNITANIGDVSPIITTVDKVIELHDSLTKTSLEKVVDKVSEGVSSLFSKAFEFVSSTQSASNKTNETSLASSASSSTLNKSFADKVNITSKEVTLTISDKVIFDVVNKSKEINTKLASSDKIKDLEKTKKTVGEFDVNKLKEELLVNKKTNELLATSIDNLKVTNLIVEKQTTEKTKESNSITKGVTGGAITGAAIGGLIGGPLGMLAGGLIGGAASSLFGSNEEEITPINNETQIQSQTITSPNNNATASTLTTNNQNITSSDNVVKILQEAVTVLKAIQAKDTSVQLALDGDVIARKITPNVNKEQVRTYSNL